jgi:ferric-dicitrate binding protein FerR (iron transport regulator)
MDDSPIFRRGEIPDLGLIDRFLAGECTPDEARLVHAWAGEMRDGDRLADVVRTIVLDGYPVGAAERIRNRLHDQLGLSGGRRPLAGVSTHVARRVARGVFGGWRDKKVAVGHAAWGRGEQTLRGGWFGTRALTWTACVALTIFCGIFATIFSRHGEGPAIAQRYHTAPGQRATIRLSDGSTVILAPVTSMVVTSANINITGEAYFAVPSHSARPFVVTTRNAVVQVLGTQFMVRQYANEPSSRVVVDAGRVMLHTLRLSAAHRTPTVLSAHMIAQVSDSGVAVTSGILPREYTSWTDGTLVFHWVTLDAVVEELMRAYGVDIHIADTVLAKRKMRMDVSLNDESITQVLDVIGEAADAHYTKDGRRFVLHTGRTTSRPSHVGPQRNFISQSERYYGR